MITRTMFVLFASFAILFAQDFRATLSGQVTDPSGAAIPNATIKATNVETNESQEAKTSTEGYYTLPYLNPGVYNVEATAPGFQLLRREGIALRVADKVNLAMKMTVGQMSQEVTVVGEQAVLDTGDASRGLVFDPIKTQEYPLNGRQTYMLMSLTPGVLFTQETIGPGGFSGTRGWDVNSSYKINGARPGTNVFLLNGARISDNGGTWDLAPNVEAVQEFKVMTNTYDAQFGGFSGGAVNTTIKSGSNAYHGDVFDYFRNSYFDANYFANNFNGQPTPYHNQHQFGGVFGGPIRKNKDYFFVSFEGWREVLPSPVLETVPTVNEIKGNFSGDGYVIYDPLTSVACNTVPGCSGHTWVRTPFSGNSIPSSRISPIAAKILGFYPTPTNLGLLANNFNAPNVKDQYAYNQPIVRVDHNFSDRDKLYGMVTWQHGTENRDQTGFGPPAAFGNINNARTDQNYIANYTHIISPRTVFDVRLSFGRFTQSDPNVGDPNFKGSNLGFPANMCAPTVPVCSAPQITMGNSIQSLFGNTVISWYSFNTWDLVPSFTLNRGKHSIHVGGEYLYQLRPSQNSGSASGSFNFDTNWTRHYSDQQQGTFDGNSVATLLLGNPVASGNTAAGSIDFNSQLYITRPFVAGYVQDDWKINNRLTMNVGLRYEVQIPWRDRFNRGIRGFDFNATNPYSAAVLANWANLAAQFNAANPNDLTGYPAPPSVLRGGLLYLGQNGVSNRAYDIDWKDFAPRIGIAYRIGEKTVLRAGGGVFYRQQQNNLSAQYGYSQTTSYNASLDGGQTPSAGNSVTGPYSLANPFPQGLLIPYGNSLGLGANAANSISINNPNYRTPRTYQYSAGFQREVPGHITLELSYSGNREIFVPVSYQMDNSPNSLAQYAEFFANNNRSSHSLPNPFLGILPAVFGNTATNPTISYGQLTRFWPLFTGLTQNYIQVGHYRSDQLQLKIEKRALGGEKAGVLTWVLSYTFGKQMQADHRLNNWNTAEAPIYEIDDGTKVHNLTFSGVYDLPFGRGRGFLNVRQPVVSKIVSDWRFDYIFSWSTGFPLGFVGGYTNTCGSYLSTNQNEYHWFNNDTACYKQIPNFTPNFLPDRFSYLFQPQGPQFNAAIEKTLPINERFKAQFRLEAFNALNTPIRQNPSTSVTNPLFGQLPKSTKNQPRVLQIAAKFFF
jgi:Carboxypeptidase regulatory-like domain